MGSYIARPHTAWYSRVTSHLVPRQGRGQGREVYTGYGPHRERISSMNPLHIGTRPRYPKAPPAPPSDMARLWERRVTKALRESNVWGSLYNKIFVSTRAPLDPKAHAIAPVYGMVTFKDPVNDKWCLYQWSDQDPPGHPTFTNKHIFTSFQGMKVMWTRLIHPPIWA